MYLAAPQQGLFGAWMVPHPPLWVSLHTPCIEFWETQKRAGCAFSHNTLLTFYSKGAQSLICAFPWGGRPFCPLGEGNNHRVLGGRVLESTSWEHVWTPGGGVCPEISA